MKSHERRIILASTLVASFLCPVYFRYATMTHIRLDHRPQAKSHGQVATDARLAPLPRILLWNTFFHFGLYGLNDSRLGEVMLDQCHPACYYTNDRCLLNSSDAVVVHMYDLDAQSLPQNKTRNQKWVFFLLEPPSTGYVRDYDKLAGYFNWTMTYRSDSDVVTPYGEIVRTGQRVPRTRDLKSLWKSKSRTAVWMASHCSTESRRELLVAELLKYTDVDTYGSCGSHVCDKEKGPICYEEFERKYFFFLAFENSLCKDYVTEKFFRALLYNLVPVVLGGANYSSLAPAGSYIDASSFETPRALAEYLKAVAGNFSAYSSYFDWKGRYTVTERISDWNTDKVIERNVDFCPLCAKLHSADSKMSTTYRDLRLWYEEGANCRRGEIYGGPASRPTFTPPIV